MIRRKVYKALRKIQGTKTEERLKEYLEEMFKGNYDEYENELKYYIYRSFGFAFYNFGCAIDDFKRTLRGEIKNVTKKIR